jgi:hypothetical protein
MTKSIVLTVPHRLGREEASARAREGMEKLRRQYLDKVARAEIVWTGDVARVTVEALGQTALATVAIFDDHARIELRLPGLLGMLSGKIRNLAQRNAEDVLRIGHSRENS